MVHDGNLKPYHKDICFNQTLHSLDLPSFDPFEESHIHNTTQSKIELQKFKSTRDRDQKQPRPRRLAWPNFTLRTIAQRGCIWRDILVSNGTNMTICCCPTVQVRLPDCRVCPLLGGNIKIRCRGSFSVSCWLLCVMRKQRETDPTNQTFYSGTSGPCSTLGTAFL